MFLDNIFGLFANDKLVNDFQNILFNELVQKHDASIALSKAMYFAEQNNMSGLEIKRGKLKFAQGIESFMERLNGISASDMEELVNLIKSFRLGENEEQETLKLALKKCLILMAQQGTPYEFDKNEIPLSIVYKNGEKLYYAHSAINVKKRKKTVGAYFSGPVGSIQICKGLKYRVGSMNVSRKTVESYDTSDKGIFYITNMRIGYLGNTQFSFELKKLVSIQNGEAGLLIYKQGRENPFMVAFDDYDAPCSILSCLLNQ